MQSLKVNWSNMNNYCLKLPKMLTIWKEKENLERQDHLENLRTYLKNKEVILHFLLLYDLIINKNDIR